MSLIVPTVSTFTQPVTDRNLGHGVNLRQVAIPKQVILDLTPGNFSCQLQLEVPPYNSQEDGSIGNRLPLQDYPSRQVVLIADNTAAVNATTGALRYQLLYEGTSGKDGSAYDYEAKEVIVLPGQEIGSTWLAFLEAQQEELVLQGNFFAYLLSTPQILQEVIQQHIQAANDLGKFA